MNRASDELNAQPEQNPEVQDASDGDAVEPEHQRLADEVVGALRQVFDPEIPVNIYDLGLIYEVSINPVERYAHVQMTLTAPGCPVAQTFPDTVRNAVLQVEGIDEADVELVWDPPWTMDRMSEAAKLQLGML